VEGRALVVQRLAGLADTLLASAQSTEVLSSVGDNVGSAESKRMLSGLRIKMHGEFVRHRNHLRVISILPAGAPPMLMSK